MGEAQKVENSNILNEADQNLAQFGLNWVSEKVILDRKTKKKGNKFREEDNKSEFWADAGRGHAPLEFGGKVNSWRPMIFSALSLLLVLLLFDQKLTFY